MSASLSSGTRARLGNLEIHLRNMETELQNGTPIYGS